MKTTTKKILFLLISLLLLLSTIFIKSSYADGISLRNDPEIQRLDLLLDYAFLLFFIALPLLTISNIVRCFKKDSVVGLRIILAIVLIILITCVACLYASFYDYIILIPLILALIGITTMLATDNIKILRILNISIPFITLIILILFYQKEFFDFYILLNADGALNYWIMFTTAVVSSFLAFVINRIRDNK